MSDEPPGAVEELLTLIGKLPDNLGGKTPKTPIAIKHLPASLQRPEVLRVAEREKFARGVVWHEGSSSSRERLPNGRFAFFVGESAGWCNAAGYGTAPTHVQLLRKGWAWLDKRAIEVVAEPKKQAGTKRRRRPRAKREIPTVEMMRAFKSREAGLSYRKIGDELDKSPETIRQWTEIVAKWNGENARSVRPKYKTLPTDRCGGAAV